MNIGCRAWYRSNAIMQYICRILPTVHAVTTSFAAKLVLFLWQIDLKVCLTNLKKMTRPDSCIHHLIPKNGMRVYCLDLEICRNTLFLLHVLKDLRGLLFYMFCAVFRQIFLKIFVMILLTLSAICVFCFILSFM